MASLSIEDISVHLDPNFAVICAFFEKFSDMLNIETPNFQLLEEYIKDSNEINSFLKDLHIKLLRKTRRTVHETAWESALSKFCHTYNSQDAWELERFGYKNSCLKVKLRILKELLESQFDRNGKFKAEMLNLKADSLRSDPIGRDHLGYSYWFTQDKDCNLRIYQEHVDENCWRIVARNRDEFINLIDKLKTNGIVTPIKEDMVDDESSISSEVDFEHDKQEASNVTLERDKVHEKVASLKIKIENINDEVNSNISTKKMPNIKLKFSHQNGLDYVENVSDQSSPVLTPVSNCDSKVIKRRSSECVESELVQFSDVIEEKPMLVIGEGNGIDCDIGNVKNIKEFETKRAKSLIEVRSTYFVEESEESLNTEKTEPKLVETDISGCCRKRRISNTVLKSPKSDIVSAPDDSEDSVKESKLDDNEKSKTCKRQKMRSKMINIDLRRKFENNRRRDESSSDEEKIIVEEQQSSKKEIDENEKKEDMLETKLNVETEKYLHQSAKKKDKCTRKEIDAKNILDTIGNPVRQSRRIAQLKIKEEAERRKMEEVALRKMKSDFKRQKELTEGKNMSSSQSEPDEFKQFTTKIVKKKIGIEKKKKREGWSSGSDEQDEDEDEPEHYYDSEKSILFKSDHEFSPESDIENVSQIIPLKRARTVRKEGDILTDKNSIIDESCMKCGKTDHPEIILLCDKCDKGYHCSCLSPILFHIPEGDWFCPPCQQDILIVSLEQRLIKFDELVLQKKTEETLKIEKEQKISYQKLLSCSDSDDKQMDKSSSEGSFIKFRSSRKKFKQINSDKDSVSSYYSDDDEDEPIYKLRKRRQINVSYRLNEYDNLIKSALKEEIQNEAGAGNLGRGKDIHTIINAADSEGAVRIECNEEEDSLNVKNVQPKQAINEFKQNLKIKSTRKRLKKKPRKLNCLDDNSQSDDDSDEDFRTSSMDNDEDESLSCATESSLELNKHFSKNRRYAARERRKDIKFIVDDSDESDHLTRVCNKEKKEDSDFSDNDESEDNSDIVDSEDLCDDSTESEEQVRPALKKKHKKQMSKILDEQQTSKIIKFKKMCDKKYKSSLSPKQESSIFNNSENLDTLRKTRGKRFMYLEDFDEDSSDGGIKPGVQRPDTPPEERAMFIKKQEEIKRMLAEQNVTTSKLSATVSDSLSTVPLSVIRQAKALDVDYLQKKGGHSNDDANSDDFDDGLPEDFNPEDMDEETIAKMMEEDFATHQLKLVGDVMNQNKTQPQLLNEFEDRKDTFGAYQVPIAVTSNKYNILEQDKSNDLSIKVIPTEIIKPRMRRKKITPLRDALQKQKTAASIVGSTYGNDNGYPLKQESPITITTDVTNNVHRENVFQKLVCAGNPDLHSHIQQNPTHSLISNSRLPICKSNKLESISAFTSTSIIGNLKINC
ncbi:RSF1 family protein [Megaselia abdita]